MCKKYLLWGAILLALLLIPTVVAYGYNYQSMAYDSHNNRYLLVYSKYDGFQGDICGQFINADGSANGLEFMISNADGYQSNPSVAYDDYNQRFLIVWEDGRNHIYSYEPDIYGQIVNADGTLYGTSSDINFVISNAPLEQYNPSVAYNNTNHEFLVVWVDQRDYWQTCIYGQLINGNGTFNGSEFVITAGYSDQIGIAYDLVNQRFLVTWCSGNINGQLINDNGSLYGASFIVSDAINAWPSNHSVTYDSVNQRFLVVWDDHRNIPPGEWWEKDIYGQLVNVDGTLYNTASDVNFVISNAGGNQANPSVAYDNVNQRFLAVWEDYRNISINSIYGQMIKSDGTLNGLNFAISNSSYGYYLLTIFNTNCANFMVTYKSSATLSDVAFCIIGGSCSGVAITNLQINGGALFSTSPTVTLTYTLSGSPTYIRTSTGVPNPYTGAYWSPWKVLPVTPTHTLNLGSVNGTRVVYAQVKDTAGNISPVVWATIKLDTIAPRGVVKINDGATTVKGDGINPTQVQLHFALFDANMTSSKMRISNAYFTAGSITPTWDYDFTTAIDWTLSAGLGLKKIYIQFKDEAGNRSPVYAPAITVSSTGAAWRGDSGVVIYFPHFIIDAPWNWSSWPSSTTTTNVNLVYQLIYYTGIEVRYLYGTSWTAWEAPILRDYNVYDGFIFSKNLTLSSTNGQRQAYIQLKEIATGKITSPQYASITLDTKAPTGAIMINYGAFSVSRGGRTITPVKLTILTNDVTSGNVKMFINQTGSTPFSSDFQSLIPSLTNYPLNTSTTGTKTVYIWFMDGAGKISARMSDSINVVP